MKREEIDKKVKEGKDKYLLWVGFIAHEDEKQRKVEYYGRFAPNKKSVIGLAMSMIDNTNPYRIIIQNTEPFKTDPSLLQSQLTDFFTIDDEGA